MWEGKTIVAMQAATGAIEEWLPARLDGPTRGFWQHNNYFGEELLEGGYCRTQNPGSPYGVTLADWIADDATKREAGGAGEFFRGEDRSRIGPLLLMKIK